MDREELDVPVAGGTLRVCRWPGDGPVVLAAHGLTANALTFAPVARALAGRVTLVAPDLRGRARSNHLPGPYGIPAHADDLVAVLDHLGVERALVVGHSTGAWVAAVAAVRHAERVRAVLLVDGAVKLRTAGGTDLDEILQGIVGPALTRLMRTFDGPGDYLDFFRSNPALRPRWSPDIEDYVLRDLVGEPGTMRSSCSLDAVRADFEDEYLDPVTTTAIYSLGCPATLLVCGRGVQDEPEGLYDDAWLDAVGIDRRLVHVETYPDLNHLSVLLDPVGAERVAGHVLAMA